MKLSRRAFLGGATAWALTHATGCDVAGMGRRALQAQAPLENLAVPVEAGYSDAFHLLSRLGYGPRPIDYTRFAQMGAEEYLQAQLKPETLADKDCTYRVRRLVALNAPFGELYEYKEDYLLRELTRAKVIRAVYSERQLYEQMVDFWSDHFNIDSSKGECRWLKVADDREVIRTHAMGSFPELLKASALSPAMLWYLDGRSNTKTDAADRPNENYARELLELHTLGVHGGYTQQDIQEVARCLTGWTVVRKKYGPHSEVKFNADQHDDGEKLVLGHRINAGGGEKDLDQVLDIVAHHPATAQYIARKLCIRFIADEVEQQVVDHIAQVFLESRGNIPSVLESLFTSEAFWQSKGKKFKRPFRYMVASMRASSAESAISEDMLSYLVRMGHAPFQYPTPDGYPEGDASWSGTLLWRWQWAQALGENLIEGVDVPWATLQQAIPDTPAFLTHFWGRSPSESELTLYHQADNQLAMAMAAPAYQVY